MKPYVPIPKNEVVMTVSGKLNQILGKENKNGQTNQIVAK